MARKKKESERVTEDASYEEPERPAPALVQTRSVSACS